MFVDVSHFTMVGFNMETQDRASFSRSALDFANQCKPAEVAKEKLVCRVTDPSGAELWIRLRQVGGGAASLETLNPGFAGEGKATVAIREDVSDPEYRPFETTLSATFGADNIPLVFDLADTREAALMKVGTTTTISLAAFCFGPELFDNSTAYYRAQKKAKTGVVFSADHFIPSGMFLESVGGAMPDGTTRPVAQADLAGTVLKASIRSNNTGHGQFWWALIKTYAGATVDVVLDSSTVRRAPKPGSVVSARCWLSGRSVQP